jgi:hypothetical protein
MLGRRPARDARVADDDVGRAEAGDEIGSGCRERVGVADVALVRRESRDALFGEVDGDAPQRVCAAGEQSDRRTGARVTPRERRAEPRRRAGDEDVQVGSSPCRVMSSAARRAPSRSAH